MQGLEKTVKKRMGVASAAGRDDGVLCAEGERALVVVAEVLFQERDDIGACVGKG